MNSWRPLSPDDRQRLLEDLDPIRVIESPSDVQQYGDAVVAPLQVSIYRHHISLIFGVEFRFTGARGLLSPKCPIRIHDDRGTTYNADGGLAILMEPERNNTVQQRGAWRIRTSLAGPVLPPVLDGGMSDGVFRWRVQQSLRPSLNPDAKALHVEMDKLEIGQFAPGDEPGKQQYILLGAMPGPWVFAISLLRGDAA